MEDLKIIFAQNLIALRKQMKLTQIELAEKINYSDKAVSKWERGESIPDVSVLMVIANLFGVSIDFLVTKHENDEIAKEQTSYAAGIKKKNRSLITAITFVAALVLELVVFITLQGANPDNLGWNALYCYVFPLPIIAIVAVVFFVFMVGQVRELRGGILFDLFRRHGRVFNNASRVETLPVDIFSRNTCGNHRYDGF